MKIWFLAILIILIGSLKIDAQNCASITNISSSTSICVGSNTTFSVVANSPDNSTLSYSWYKNGTVIANAISSTYTITNAQLADASSYYVKVSNACGTPTSSAIINLSVGAIPSISSISNAAESLCVGSSFSTSVIANANSIPFTYQWYLAGVPIVAQTSSSLNIASLQSSHAGLYSVTQFMNTAVQNMCKVYPSILLNDVGFYKKVHNHWGFSDKHKDIISKFIEQYYEKIEKFKGDSVLLRLLMEVDLRLTDLPIFLQNLPFFTEMIKDMGDDIEGERIRSFYCLFDKETIYLLYTYSFYSAIYEYIVSANDPDLLRADVQEIKQSHRKQIRERANVSNQLKGRMGKLNNDLNDFSDELNEVEVITGDLEELKKRVASLLLCFLNVEEDNKDAINYSYAEIMQKVKRDKDI